MKKIRNRTITLETVVLGALILLAVLVPILSPYAYDMQNVREQNLPVCAAHWFGTDRFGRDIFTRVFYGMRISLMIGISASGISLAIGALVGAAAGWRGGIADTLLLELMNVISAVPSMLYVILIMLVFQAGVGTVILGICVSGWVELGRMVRSETKRLKEADFCMAARMMGIPGHRIFRKYILRGQREMLIAQTMLLIPKAIFTEAFLSFIGIGLAAPQASLGSLIQDARSQFVLYPWQMIFPGVILAAAILCFQSIGYRMEEQRAGRRISAEEKRGEN